MKNCLYCGKELIRKTWIGKRKYKEASKRFAERKFCDNICRSGQLSIDGKGNKNYFFGKHLIPHNRNPLPVIKTKTGKGYIQIRYWLDNGERFIIYEHRSVIENELGRKLDTNEHVHHINENIEDNRPENLLVCSALEHRRLHQEK